MPASPRIQGGYPSQARKREKNRCFLCPPGVGSMSGRLLVLYSPNKLGKGALLPQCKEGEPGAAEEGAFSHRLSCLHIALLAPTSQCSS